ncbi:MAG TPA: methyltransferase [Verrucomicrobiales bacterium]|nr:methyltransferase [Verrucomicrobiales bacterium]
MPADLTTPPSSDPLQLYRHRDAIYSTDLLAAALVWLDFFTWLTGCPSTLDGICTGLSLHPRPVDVMLTLFKGMGLVEERDGVFSTSLVAREHLVSGSPWFLGPYYASMKERSVTRDFVTVLRTGKPANWASYKDEKAWAQAMEGEAFARQFTAAMDCRGVYLGQALARSVDLAGCRRLLDIAGGSGIYSCALLAANPALSGVVLEKSPVDRICRGEVDARGYGSRIEVVTGDMFRDPWPRGADVHLISNVLHDWDFPEVRELLRRSAEALPSGGMLLVHDVHINREKTGPLPNAQYSALLMCITEGKCYSVGEMEGLLREAGFGPAELRTTAADRSVLVCRRA